MSWQLGSLAILALALAGGFAWYERSKPDARIVALVGTLAAFAALGRIAFAALPNVKPTTDIVLIAGYTLGGGPGFVVGALAALTSNFFFGQGPWTPWQMAAWAATGLLGASLAVLTRRRIGRIPLAIVCGVAGFAFTVVQDVGDWVTYSDHSLAQLGVYVGKGLGFDAVHAAGCVAFALAFGPALIRSVQRFTTRLAVTWLPAGRAPMLVVLVVAGAWLAGQPPVGGGAVAAAATPSGYLLAAENADGGFGPSPGASSSQLFSGWAALGLAAAGYNPLDVAHGGPSLLDYIRAGSGSFPDAGALERTILAVRAAGLPAGSFDGHDLVADLQRDLKPDGSVADQVNLTSFAVLALRSADVTPPARTMSWLARQQDSDGGFNFATAGGTSDADDTGAALQALAGSNARTMTRAVSFLRGQQNHDGGFPAQPGGDSNAQSTAWAIQGLIAAGRQDAVVQRALGYLRSLTAPDGHVRYDRSSDQTPVWVTAMAQMSLAGKPMPLAAVPRRAQSGSGTGSAATTGGSQRHAGRAPKSPPKPVANPRPVRLGASSAAAHTRGKRHAPQLNLDRFASVAGVATALLLAPVGLS